VKAGEKDGEQVLSDSHLFCFIYGFDWIVELRYGIDSGLERSNFKSILNWIFLLEVFIYEWCKK
jgi:hypothetical protein